jgi:hypothetical protein
MTVAKLIAVVALAASLSVPASAQGLPKAASPDEIGISTQRLKRLSAAFQSDVPGAVLLIARDGKVAFFDALAFRIARSAFP